MAPLLFIIYALLFIVKAVAADFTWPYWSFNSVPFQPPKLDIIETDEAPAPGLLFLGPKGSDIQGVLPNGGSSAAAYDQDGTLVWKGPDIETSNLQVQTLFGKPVLTYWSGKKIDGYGFGVIHILDDAYQEIYRVTLKGDYTTPNGEPELSYIDLHESKITERNTILVTSYNLTQIDTASAGGQPDTWVLKSAFHEIEVATNKVLFSWSPLDHPGKTPITTSRAEFYPGPRSRDDPWDIYHINSVDDAASGYIISLRHSFSATYVNRDGSIKWHLDGQNGGDFDLCQTCKFCWQHHISIFDETPDGLTLTVFNNDGKEGPDKGLPTTGLVLGVDLNTMTVTNKRRLIDPQRYLNSDTQGSLQALGGNANGNMLMGYGSWATVKEFNAKGDVIWTARFGPDAQIASYRSFKSEWHATPWYPPAIKSTAYLSPTSRRSTHLYVSWNGATDIGKWNFYAQSSYNATPVLIESQPKKDFETAFIVEGYLDRVLVEPIHVNGTALPASPVQRTRLHGDWTTGVNQTAPIPDDPSKVAAAIPNSTPGSTSEDVEDEDTSKSDPYSTAGDDFELDESNKLANQYGEENGGMGYSGISSAYGSSPWVDAALIFFTVCLLATIVLVSLWLYRIYRRCKKPAWWV